MKNQKIYKHPYPIIIIYPPGLHCKPGFFKNYLYTLLPNIKMENNKDHVIIFIDGSNLYHIIKNMFRPSLKLKHFNFEKFCQFIAGDRKLIRTYYYNSPLDWKKNQEAYIKQQKFFEKLNRIPSFKLVLCRMQKVKIEGKTVYQVKEDDIHLAVDMVKLAYNKAYDTAILVSSDGDFSPAIQAVNEIGKKVENIGFENKFSYHLQRQCDTFKILRKGDVMKFFEQVKFKARH